MNKNPWITAILASVVVAASFWVVIFSLTAIGIGPLARFSPGEVDADNFDATVNNLGREQVFLEERIIAPVLILFAVSGLVLLRVPPSILRSVIIVTPLGLLIGGGEALRGAVLLAMYSALHDLLHLAASRIRST